VLHYFTFRIFSTLLTITLYSTVVQCHPHSWVTLKSDFILNNQSDLTEIRQRWRFDHFYSSITIAEIKNEFGDRNKKGFHIRAKQITKNLKQYNFFSRLIINDNNKKLPKPKNAYLNILEEDGLQILELEMHFEFSVPIKIENKKVSWSVYDPTYYISMLYEDLTEFVVIGGNATECSKELFIPEPSEETINYARSLDQGQKGTAGLGDSFAEQILLNCY